MKRMKSYAKFCGVLITLAAILILTGAAASVQIQAKTKKPYKTETIKLVEGRKTVWDSDHNSHIKKIKVISKNKKIKTKIIDYGCELFE